MGGVGVGVGKWVSFTACCQSPNLVIGKDGKLPWHYPDDMVFVIGGGEVYQQIMDYAYRLYITEIHEEFEGDSFSPKYCEDVGKNWKEVIRDDREDLSFVIYDRVSE